MDREHLFLFWMIICPIILLLISIVINWRKSSFNDTVEKEIDAVLTFIQIPLVVYVSMGAWNHELSVVWAVGLCVLFCFDTFKKWLINLIFAIHDRSIKH